MNRRRDDGRVEAVGGVNGSNYISGAGRRVRRGAQKSSSDMTFRLIVRCSSRAHGYCTCATPGARETKNNNNNIRVLDGGGVACTIRALDATRSCATIIVFDASFLAKFLHHYPRYSRCLSTTLLLRVRYTRVLTFRYICRV